MARKKKEKDVMEKNWNCLGTLKSFFETSKQEKVSDFDGYSLTTKKYVYTLYDGQLTRRDR